MFQKYQKKRRKLALLVLCQTKIRIVQLWNALDADLKIILSQKGPKPPKDSEKRRKSDKSKERGNRACNNSNDYNDHKVYTSMARMSSDDKNESKDYGTQWEGKLCQDKVHILRA